MTGEATVRLFVRDLVLSAAIGIHPHEQGRRQRIRINLDLSVEDWRRRDAAGAPGDVEASGPEDVGPDDVRQVVSYETLVDAARRFADRRHWPLVETLAEHLAAAALADTRVLSVRVRVEKLDVFTDAAAVGVEITRHRPPA